MFGILVPVCLSSPHEKFQPSRLSGVETVVDWGYVLLKQLWMCELYSASSLFMVVVAVVGPIIGQSIGLYRGRTPPQKKTTTTKNRYLFLAMI